MYIGTTPRKILCAQPETFIHIFVHKKDKLIEFLEHMTKVGEGKNSRV